MIKNFMCCDICGEPYRTLPKEQKSTFADENNTLFSKKLAKAFPMEIRYKAGALVDICPACHKAIQETLNRLGGVNR